MKLCFSMDSIVSKPEGRKRQIGPSVESVLSKYHVFIVLRDPTLLCVRKMKLPHVGRTVPLNPRWGKACHVTRTSTIYY